MTSKIRNISILGSTGSIGRQTLDILRIQKDEFNVIFLTSNSNWELLIEQCNEFNPKFVFISDKNAANLFELNYSKKIKVYSNYEDLIEICRSTQNDLIVSSLVGFAGVEPTYAALESGIDVALANKETLVSAGAAITKKAKEKNAKIFAIDSEHSAILQCLIGENYDQISRLILTASGGPFRSLEKDKFKEITVESALKHPNWSMGQKITIDSATLMNKGLEIIEAKWLFDVPHNKIDVLVHPQSIIHSIVEFNDSSQKAQLGLPNMRIPIAYALNYPNHKSFDFPKLNLAEIGTLTFEEVDFEKFTCLKSAYLALEKGSIATASMNACNEIAVDSFLKKEISFNSIGYLAHECVDNASFGNLENIKEIVELDKEIRLKTKEIIIKSHKI